MRSVAGCRRGVASIEFALIAPTLMILLFGLIAIGTVMFTWSAMQSSAQYAALMVSTGQVKSLSSGTISVANNTATTACSGSLTSSEAEYYACSALPGWGSFSVTTTEDCTVPSVTVTVSANAATVALGDILSIFGGRTLSAQSVVMKEGLCP